jgi:hypothetical protein
LLQAEALKEGAGAYNLACMAALHGQEEECREWLAIAEKENTLEDRAHMETDSDLESVRQKPWFQDLLRRL